MRSQTSVSGAKVQAEQRQNRRERSSGADLVATVNSGERAWLPWPDGASGMAAAARQR